MNTSERVMAVVNGETIDRIPIYAPYVTSRMMNPAGFPVSSNVGYLLLDGVPFTDPWMENDSNYREIMNAVSQRGDQVYSYGFPELDRRFFMIPKEYIKLKEVKRNEQTTTITYAVHTPEGDLEYICGKNDNISTVWDIKPLVESQEDIHKLLSAKYYFQKPDLDLFHSYKARVDEQKGLIYIFVSNPMVCVSQLMHFEKFLIWSMNEEPLLLKLINIVYERIAQQLQYLLEQGIGPIYHFGGSEQGTPPMMSPKQFDKYVYNFDKRLFDLIHSYNQFVAVHCHGRVKGVLKKFLSMGVDMIDPVESPPNGDVEIKEAQELTVGMITFVGNIQFGDMELCTAHEISEKVKLLIKDTGKKRFILGTTEGPISPVSSRMKDNYIQMIETGDEYGKL